MKFGLNLEEASVGTWAGNACEHGSLLTSNGQGRQTHLSVSAGGSEELLILYRQGWVYRQAGVLHGPSECLLAPHLVSKDSKPRREASLYRNQHQSRYQAICHGHCEVDYLEEEGSMVPGDPTLFQQLPQQRRGLLELSRIAYVATQPFQGNPDFIGTWSGTIYPIQY